MALPSTNWSAVSLPSTVWSSVSRPSLGGNNLLYVESQLILVEGNQIIFGETSEWSDVSRPSTSWSDI